MIAFYTLMFFFGIYAGVGESKQISIKTYVAMNEISTASNQEKEQITWQKRVIFCFYHLFTLVKLRATYFPRKIVPQNLARVPSKINLKIQINVTRIYDKAKVAV